MVEPPRRDACPRCAAGGVEERRESDGWTYSYDYHCVACNHWWSTRGGITMSRALSLADAPDPTPRPVWMDLKHDAGTVAIARTAITAHEYTAYTNACGRWWDGRGGGTTAAQVRFSEALDYAAWCGARLPTPVEWRAVKRSEPTWTTAGPHGAAKAGIRLVRADLPAPRPGDPVADELLAAIYADPAADAPRSVYADHLQQRGDPRGELIALQLQRGRGSAPAERERELLDLHAPVWLGPIFGAIDPTSMRFERGFLTACRALDGPLARAAIGDSRWQTVEQLEDGLVELIAHPCMRALRDLAAPVDTLARLASGDVELSVEALAGPRAVPIGFGHDPIAWHTIGSSRAFGRVRAIVLDTDYAPGHYIMDVLLATPLGRRLERVAITSPANDYALDAWLPLVEQRRPARVTLRIAGGVADANPAVIVVEPGHVRCSLERPTTAGVAPAFSRALTRLANAGIRRIELAVPPSEHEGDLATLAPGIAHVDIVTRDTAAPE